MKNILFDEQDKHLLKFHWTCDGRTIRGCVNGKVKIIGRLILDAPVGFLVDHINGDIFDNQKHNLRIVTTKANTLNHKRRCINSVPRSTKWHVYLGRKYLGAFINYEEACVVYDLAHKSLLTEELSKTRHLNLHLTDEEFYYYCPPLSNS